MIKRADDDLPIARSNIWIYLLSIVPAVFIALLVPDNVLSQSPTLEQLTALISQFVPAIDRLAAVSGFPEVTRLVLSIEWTLLPLQTFLFVINKSYAVRVNEWRRRRFFITSCLLLFASVLFWSVFFLYYLDISDLQGGMFNEWLLRSLSESRLGLGSISSVFLSGTALIVGLLCVWARFIPHIYFGYEGKTQR